MRELLAGETSGRLRYSEVDGAAMLRQAHTLNLEGIVPKVIDSKYHGERVGTWMKTVCQYREALTIIGYVSAMAD